MKRIVLSLIVLTASGIIVSSAETQPSIAESLTGNWVYQHTWEDKAGDEVTAEETWNFLVEGPRISGWYERRVNKTSKDGRTYTCNHALTLERKYRKYFAGKFTGTGFTITENKYELTSPGACEQGDYKFFKYAGEFLAGNQLKLKTDSFSQTLSRTAAGYSDPEPLPPQSHNLSGVWSWDNNYEDEYQNSVTEHEVWTLTQIDTSVFGQYLRTVKYQSLDGSTFNCNSSLSFEREMKLLVSGHNEQNRISLEEISYTNYGDPRCALEERILMQYNGTYDGSEELGLYYGDNKFQRLTKINDLTPQRNYRTYSRSLSGTWKWQAQHETEDGDLYEVEETFDLLQDGANLEGTCLRTKRLHAAPGQVFRCNGSDIIELRTLYRLKGLWDDGGFVFFEEGYNILSDSPCDSGRRTRRQYTGIYQGGGQMDLVYGEFGQTLSRE